MQPVLVAGRAVATFFDAADADFSVAFHAARVASPLVWDAWTSKTGVLPLADRAAAEGRLLPSRAAYAAFLAAFPLCYGYWKKWALQEWAQHPLGADAAFAAAAGVWEAGAGAATHCVELWAGYAEWLASARPADAARLRALLRRALDVCGEDPRAGALLWKPLELLEAAAGAEAAAQERKPAPNPARAAEEAAVAKRPYFHVKPLDAALLQVRSLPRAPFHARAPGAPARLPYARHLPLHPPPYAGLARVPHRGRGGG
jgi:hypothetical protein